MSGETPSRGSGNALAELLEEGDFRFHMGLGRGTIEDFFAPTPDHSRIIAEREKWLDSSPELYAAVLPEGIPLLHECLGRAAVARSPESGESALGAREPIQQLHDLGTHWEPDFLLLNGDDADGIRLRGGCVCFPSSWSLPDKMGLPIAAIHGVVPGLNSSLGPQIRSFLERLKPGVAWQRSNWGLSRSSELNQHPSRGLPRLQEDTPMNEVWFRVEHQVFAKLPVTGGILFGIRVTSHPLGEISADPAAASRLARALESMPEAVAVYKGVHAVRASLIKGLRSCCGH